MVRRVEAARKKVGPDGAVMFDAHCAVPPATLIQFAAAIQPYDVLFIEEPAVPGNIEVFKRLKEQIRIPLATGERDRTIWEMHRRTCTNGCIDILQPDWRHTGGISQMKKIATLAEAFSCRWRRTARPRSWAWPPACSRGLGAAVPDPRGLSRHHAQGVDAEELGAGQGRLRRPAAGAGAGRRDRRGGDGEGVAGTV